jgi:hypothetical protein
MVSNFEPLTPQINFLLFIFRGGVGSDSTFS